MISIFFLFGCLLLISNLCQAASISRTKELYDKLFQNYSTDFRPVIDQEAIIQINVTMALFTLNEFDDVKGSIKVSVFAIIQWRDECLVWNATEYNTTFLTLPENKVWLPRFAVASPIEDIKYMTNKYFKVRVYHTGEILWQPIAVLKFACPPDVTKFPFDEHDCRLEVIPFGYDSDEIKLVSTTDTLIVDRASFVENTEWEILKTKSESYDIENVQFLFCNIKIKRRHMHSVVNIILPIILLLFVSPFVFLLPNDSGERTSYSITVLLAFSVYMTVINDNMPSSSLPVAYISYFLLSTMVTNAIIVILNITQIKLYAKHHTSDNPTLPKCLLYFINVCGKKKRRRSRHNPDTIEMESEIQHENKLYSNGISKPASGIKQDWNKDLRLVLKETNEKNETATQLLNSELTWVDIASTLDKIYFATFFLLEIILLLIFAVL